MQRRVVLVIVAAVLGLAATVLGIVAGKKSKGFVSFESLDKQHCVYRRNPGFGCGVAGALLALMAVFLATAASRDGPDAPTITGGRRGEADAFERHFIRLMTAWVVVLVATVLFLYGAAMKRSPSSSCAELKSVIFGIASTMSVVATGYAIAAVFSFERTDESAPSVEMGHPAPPQYEHDGYGARQPAGTA